MFIVVVRRPLFFPPAKGRDTINEEEVAIEFLKDFDKWRRELKTRVGIQSERLLPVTGCALAEEARDQCHEVKQKAVFPISGNNAPLRPYCTSIYTVDSGGN